MFSSVVSKCAVFAGQSTGDVTSYVTSADMEKWKKCFLHALAIYLHGYVWKPPNESRNLYAIFERCFHHQVFIDTLRFLHSCQGLLRAAEILRSILRSCTEKLYISDASFQSRGGWNMTGSIMYCTTIISFSKQNTDNRLVIRHLWSYFVVWGAGNNKRNKNGENLPNLTSVLIVNIKKKIATDDAYSNKCLQVNTAIQSLQNAVSLVQGVRL